MFMLEIHVGSEHRRISGILEVDPLAFLGQLRFKCKWNTWMTEWILWMLRIWGDMIEFRWNLVDTEFMSLRNGDDGFFSSVWSWREGKRCHVSANFQWDENEVWDIQLGRSTNGRVGIFYKFWSCRSADSETNTESSWNFERYSVKRVLVEIELSDFLIQ